MGGEIQEVGTMRNCDAIYAGAELPIPSLITGLVLPFQVRPSKMAGLFSFHVVPFPFPPSLHPRVPLRAMHHPGSGTGTNGPLTLKVISHRF